MEINRNNLQVEHDRLLGVFNEIKNPDDWRAPIHLDEVPAKDVGKIIDAISFFTGTESTVKPHPRNVGMYIVDSVGYRNGPCGP